MPILTAARANEKALTTGFGQINQTLDEALQDEKKQSLFDLMRRISEIRSKSGDQKPQFLFWGKTNPQDIMLDRNSF